MIRRRLLWAGAAVTLLAGAVAVALQMWRQPEPVAAASVATTTATVEIVRGPLHDTKTVTGTLGYGDLTTLRVKGATASAMLTWIAPEGATVERGAPLYRLEGEPTILFYGTEPQSRTLRFDPGSDAPVWVELERADRALAAATLELELARARLDDSEARRADTSARLVDAALPDPADPQAKQLVNAVNTAAANLDRLRELAAAQLTPKSEVATSEDALATARATRDIALRALRKDEADARLDAAAAKVAIAEAEAKLDAATAARGTLFARAANELDVRQIADNLKALGYRGPIAAQVRAWQQDEAPPATGVIGPGQLHIAAGPVHVAAHKGNVGEIIAVSSADGGAIIDVSATSKVVSVRLAVADQGLAAPGRAVVVTLPDDRTVDGTITKVGSVVTDGTTEVTIDIADQPALAGLAVAWVDVAFVSESRDAVLSVPITALLADPQGGFTVETVADSRSAIVPVDTGLFAAGRVEISGDGIAEGMLVSVPR